MPKLKYVNKNFREATLEVIANASEILEDFTGQGYKVTLRSLYYRFIGLDLFPDSWIDEAYNASHGLPANTKNTPKNYKRLIGVMTDARLAGLIDWEMIVDQTRNIKELGHWDSPAQVIETYANYYHVDKWVGQEHRPELWLEKDTLVGMVEGTCRELDVPFIATRGYMSLSEMWVGAQRLLEWEDQGYTPIILHMSDHDPSGIDMSRDIQDRLGTFGLDVVVLRIALTIDQVEENNCPPNPAKITDARADSYIQEFGTNSWELEALAPSQMNEIVRDAVLEIRDDKLHAKAVKKENAGRAKLKKAAKAMRKTDA